MLESLDNAEHVLNDDGKALFLAFIRNTLKWDPQERPITKESLDTDPWLNIE